MMVQKEETSSSAILIPIRRSIMSQEFTEKYLKDNGFDLIDDVDAEGNTPLIKAVIEEGVTLVNALIEAGADVNQVAKSYDTAMFKAIELGKHQIVEALTEAGVNLDLHPRLPLDESLLMVASRDDGGMDNVLKACDEIGD
jgi:ankyrin repeat protein